MSNSFNAKQIAAKNRRRQKTGGFGYGLGKGKYSVYENGVRVVKQQK